MQRIINKNIKKIQKLDPTPPPGSDWDQTTLNYPPEGGLPIEKNHPIGQTIYNDRDNITGYGILGGYLDQTGSVTKPLEIILETRDKIIKLIVSPNEIDPGYYYFLGADFPQDPVPATDRQAGITAITDNDIGQAHGWIWGGLTGNKYPDGKIFFWNGSEWIPQDDLDGNFWTFTETDAPPGKTIGTIGSASKWYNGPYPANTNQRIADLEIKNTGDKAGEIKFEVYEYPEGANRRILSGAGDFAPGGKYTFNLDKKIPNKPGENWPLGVKVWSEDESKPSWSRYNDADMEVLY